MDPLPRLSALSLDQSHGKGDSDTPKVSCLRLPTRRHHVEVDEIHHSLWQTILLMIVHCFPWFEIHGWTQLTKSPIITTGTLPISLVGGRKMESVE